MPIVKRPHFEKLFTWAEKGRIAPLYLFYGDEDLSEKLSRRLYHFFRQKGIFTEEIDLSQVSSEVLLASLSAPSLLGRKAILVLAGEKALPLAGEIQRLLETHRRNLTLLLPLGEIEEGHPLCLFAREAGVLMPLPRRKHGDLLRYEIPEMLAIHDKKMDRETAERLLSLVGEDLEFLAQEIEKLALYVGEKPVISLRDVEAVVSPKPETAPYRVLEALFAKGPEEALEICQDLLREGVHPLVLVATFLTFFKRLWLFLELLSTEKALGQARDYALFQRLLKEAKQKLWSERPPKTIDKAHPYALFRLLPTARFFQKKDFTEVFSSLLQLDEALKSGFPPEEAFYRFFVRLKNLPLRSTSATKKRPFL